MKKLRPWHYLFLLVLVISTIWILRNRTTEMQNSEGRIFGTTYHAKYEYPTSLETEIMERLQQVDATFSMFNPNSLLSRINRGEEVAADSLFARVFTLAQTVSAETNGAFDITVAPLVNAWGFGFSKADSITPALIDSLLPAVGYTHVRLTENGQIEKLHPRVMMDCGAIAKGFAVDHVAAMFDSLGIRNFMIEIGGEVVVRGTNSHGKPWRIGVSVPKPEAGNADVQAVLSVTNKAMATSGNYRNHYVKDGKRYAHTIHPRTGYPVQHSLLSASVVAPDCATADAYATAFMVVGLDSAKSILEQHPELMGYFIYENADGEMATWCTPRMNELLETE